MTMDTENLITDSEKTSNELLFVQKQSRSVSFFALKKAPGQHWGKSRNLTKN